MISECCKLFMNTVLCDLHHIIQTSQFTVILNLISSAVYIHTGVYFAKDSHEKKMF